MDSRGVGPAGWALLACACLYVALLSIYPLASHWAADPQYHFGYLVPILAVPLFARRWTTRPLPSPCARRATIAVVTLLLLFLPAWILLQPNPDWRLLNWIATTLCTGFLLAVAAVLGGRPWTRHFAFPSFFILTAVPWPTELEWPITQGLMRGVATAAAEILSIAGVPAIAHGNLVEIANGTLGVDLACSGIRSLQPSLMMALFLGELFRFDLSRRVALFLAGIAAAFLTNLGRVLVLGWVAAAQGLSAIDRWHDPAGSVLMTICFALVWGTALLIGRDHPQPAGGLRPVTPWPRSFWPMLGILWIVVSVSAGEIWFRPLTQSTGTPWKFAPPDAAEKLNLDAETLAMLRFDRGGGWKWKAGAGQEWIAYDMVWDPGPTRSRMLLSMHRPDICLAAVGLRLREDRGVVTAKASGAQISFQAYIFDSPRGPLHVYYALYRNGEPVLERESSVRNACLRAVAERRRLTDQRVLQLAVAGCPGSSEADRALHALLTETLHFEK
jgi:exosortase